MGEDLLTKETDLDPVPPSATNFCRSLSPKIFYVYKELIIQASLIQSAY